MGSSTGRLLGRGVQAALGASVLLLIAASAKECAEVARRLGGWRRTPAVVRSTADPLFVEVWVGSGDSEETWRVPRSPGAGYDHMEDVDVLEDPERPGVRALASIFDLGRTALAELLLALFSAAALGLVRRERWGQALVWRAGGWEPDGAPASPVHARATAPPARLKANVFWGLALGVPAIASALLMDGDVIERAFLGGLGAMFVGLIVVLAIENRGLAIGVRDDGVIEESALRRRRVPFEAIRKIARIDLREDLEAFNEIGRSRWRPRPFSTIPAIEVWELRDLEGRRMFWFGDDLEPGPAKQQIVDRVQRESTALRKRAQTGAQLEGPAPSSP